jgi:hypothetical protein
MSKTPEMQAFVDDMANKFFGPTKEGCCVVCKKPFSSENVLTKEYEKEVPISKMCELCWNETFKDMED